MTATGQRSKEHAKRQRPPILAMMVLAGSTLPLTGFSCMKLLGPGAMAPITGLEIANLVIIILQLVMQIVQFVFIIEQIFIWESDYAPED